MASVTIDGETVSVAGHATVLEVAGGLGIDIPTFCYIKRLTPLASCRMCLVEIEGVKKLQPSCATAITDGMVVRTNTPAVAEMRTGMLELILANHPLDCPVCDKGGECELQDMTFAYGPGESRFEDPKRVFHSKDIVLNPVIVMNVNRCIQCQRCVRICEDVVGAVALGTVEKGMDTAVTGFEGSLAGCDHCGNCVEVCPVGALMSLPYRYKARPWDLTETDTICPYCGTGCHLTVGLRDGKLMRVRSKWETGLNLETLCATGRFGFDVMESADRIRRPMVRKDGALAPVSWEEAGSYLKERIAGKQMGGLASARLTNEALYMFQKMMRMVFDCDPVASSTRWTAPDLYSTVRGIGNSRAPLTDLLDTDCTIVIGSNVTEENPVSEYLIREAVRAQRTKLAIVSTRPSRLDADATLVRRCLPGGEAVVLSEVLASLADANRLTFLIGTDVFRSPVPSLQGIHAQIRGLKKEVAVQFLFDRANQMGAWDLGLGADFGHMLDLCEAGEMGAMYVLGSDPLLSYPDGRRVKDALGKLDLLIVQDAFLTDTAGMADVVLPAATFAEEHGTITNNEGRAQVVRKLRNPAFDAGGSLQIFRYVASLFGHDLAPSSVEAVFEEITREVPVFRGLTLDGLGEEGAFTSAPGSTEEEPPDDFVIPEPARPTGLLLVTGNGLIHSGYLSERSEVLNTVVTEPYVEMGPGDAGERGLADGDPVVVQSTRGQLRARLKINKQFPDGLVFVPENFRALRLNLLLGRGEYPCPVEVQKEARSTSRTA